MIFINDLPQSGGRGLEATHRLNQFSVRFGVDQTMAHAGPTVRVFPTLTPRTDLPFAQKSIAAAPEQATTMFRVLQEFGWLLNPDKCGGLHVALQVFHALGTRQTCTFSATT